MRVDYKRYVLETDKNIDTRIAHISDIHFAHKYNSKRLEMILKKIKKINPNYICITGDTVDIYDVVYDSNYPELVKFIEDLSKIGKVIISVGNHEYIRLYEDRFGRTDDIEWLKKLKNENVIVLDNEVYEENNISFIGYNPDYEYYYTHKEKKPDKYNKELEKLIDKTKNEYKILLVHTPSLLLRKENYKNIKNSDKLSLTLCGHTHGGMMPSILPGHFGIISPTREYFPKNIRGKIKAGNNTVIISSGIMKLSRKSKITFLNDIYGSNIIKIDIKHKIISKKYWFYNEKMVFLECKQDRA